MTVSAAPALPESRYRWRAWLVLVALVLAIGALPQVLALPQPQAEYRIDTAEFEHAGTLQRVTLPHSWNDTTVFEPPTAVYRLSFDGAVLPDEPAFLFLPAVRHKVQTWINGEPAMSATNRAWTSSNTGYSYVALLPTSALRDGSNEIVIRHTLDTGWLSGYLSPVYLGTARDIMPHHQMREFIIGEPRAMTFTLHMVIMMGIVAVWAVRRHDSVFRWLAVIAVTSLFVVVSQSSITAGLGRDFQIYFSVAMSAVGLMALGMANAIVERPTPDLLMPAILITPALLLLLGLSGVVPLPLIGLTSALGAVAAYAVSAIILAADFAGRRNWDAAFLAVPFALTVWFGLHDILLVAGIGDSAFLLANYARLLLLVAIMVILMSRLARSLNELDSANETLRQRLAEQESALVVLHEKQRARTAELAREHERERLMHDLHDGLSGHLVSIIALSENADTDPQAIETSAREALNDLRLVVQSLDIGDRDLLVALAGFRERLAPQLRRLGVTLEWSMEAMPEVAGVTPGNALAILRILQEAVTNALKHGPATRISIRGTPERGGASILVENDGGMRLPPGSGKGLSNMRRRAQSVGGAVTVDLHDAGARLALHLPARLHEATA